MHIYINYSALRSVVNSSNVNILMRKQLCKNVTAIRLEVMTAPTKQSLTSHI